MRQPEPDIKEHLKFDRESGKYPGSTYRELYYKEIMSDYIENQK